MDTELAERFTASTEQWTCVCGRTNVAGLSMCPHCGRRPPRGVATVSLALPGRPSVQPRIRGIRLAVGVIVLNIVNQVVAIVMVRSGHMEPSTAITLVTWLGLAFYGIVLAMITAPLLTLKPNWLRGDPRTARLLGAEVGFAAAVVLIALAWAVAGHPVPDPSGEALVSEGSLPRIILAFLAVAVVAPVVEELLFRGVVAESLRRHGAFIAILVSSVLFSLAHLHWSVAGITYFSVCGVVLGVLYWRRGLWASIAAHAAFNGSLVLLAVVVVLGPAHVLASNGISVRAPSDWRLAETGEAPTGAALAVRGPSGASLLVERLPIPTARRVNLDALAAALNSGQIPLPPESTIEGRAHVATYPAGQGVEVGVKVRGHSGVVALIARGGLLWEVDIATAGSSRAAHEYPDILKSLTLPTAAGAV
jgi:CAAX protease family protein